MRAAEILAFAITPYRFRTGKQFWNYCGLGLRSKITAEYELIQGQVGRSKKRPLLRGLTALEDQMSERGQTASQHCTLGAIVDHIEHLEAGRKADLELGDQILVTTRNSTYSIYVLEEDLYSVL